MDIKVIKEALEASKSLICGELECIELEELKEDYLAVIQKVEVAIGELSSNG